MGPETMLEMAPRLPRARAGPPPLLLQMARHGLWLYALACAATALLLGASLWAGLLPAGLLAYVLPCTVSLALLGGAAALATRLGGSRPAEALTLLLALSTLLVAFASRHLDSGLAALGMLAIALALCGLCTVAGHKAGWVLAAVAAAAVVGLALAARTGPAAGAKGLQVALYLLAIAAGLGAGVTIARVMQRITASACEREERFGRLLALAADAYWEIDRNYRLLAAGEQNGAQRSLSAEQGLGRLPWELPQLHCEADALDALIADLDARQPFRDVAVRWAGSSGRVRSLLASGEPRFDERGVFTGYWGVAHDVTVVDKVHAALAATETRYQELFMHIPTPLVLHRGGRVLDANPAALSLLGAEELPALVGRDLLTAYESGDSRERERRRIEQLHGQAPGTALPVADFRLHSAGRALSVRGTSVNVQAEGGMAMLAIFVDDTERLAAEEAVRRSEALLSHLVATSPDVITLTEMSTGRYAMVNHSFERLLGWRATEAVGRTAGELGVWGSDPAARDNFVALVRDKGVVSDLPVPFSAKSGKTVQLLLSAARFVMERREYMVINARDVSERERQRLEREAILDNASIGIAVTRQLRLVLTNRHFERIFGWADNGLVGLHSSVLWADGNTGVAGRGSAAAAGDGAVELERQGRRKDGSSFTARVRARAIDPARAHDGTVWIVEDVTERRQFEQALARARDDAEAASRAKSAFLANTSHELSTPLNGLIGLARLALDEPRDEARRRRYLEQIAQSAEALGAIIADILDLSKIEAGKLLIERTPFDLAAELQALQDSHAPLAAAGGLELRLELAPDVSGVAGMGNLVHGDPLRVRQIVGNFVTNAIKFTASGFVAVAVRRLENTRRHIVRIEVQDSGPGIDAATSARLFKPFTQADQGPTRRFGGTGLGLAICRGLATLMGGTVGIESRPGEGSTFWAELPLPPADASAAAETGTTPPPPAAAASLLGRRVLMVEDNPVNMLIAVAMLERWGLAVGQAHDGGDAVAAVERAAADGRPYDAVLMDVQMPAMSGHEATRALRAAGHTLPIVALTAAALVSEREAALAAGMNDFLTKPIDAQKLHAALLRWCAGAHES